MAAKRNIQVINLIYIMAVALLVMFYSLIFTLMSINVATFPTPSRPTQLTIKLIHHDSIISPYNNSNENPAHRVQRGINISIARLAYLQEKIRSHNTYQAHILPSNDISNSLFYVNISIGRHQSHNSQPWTPAAPFYGFIATLAEIAPRN